MPYRQTASISGLIWRNITVRASETVVTRRQNKASSEQDVLEQMEEDGQEVAVESASVHVESGSHPMRLLYVPSTSGEGTAVFTTNVRVGLEEAEAFCKRYSRRWQTEIEYKSIKGAFSRRPPRKTTVFVCSTSCSRCCCTISGGSPTSC